MAANSDGGAMQQVIRPVLILLMLLAVPLLTFGHGSEAQPPNIWTLWEFDPLIIVVLVCSATVYGLGLRNLWRSAGVGHGISKIEAAYYILGWLSLAVALVSPIHLLGELLFSMHMTQHEILMLIAAPLI